MYEPAEHVKEDTLRLLHWEVYVDQFTEQVTRIHITRIDEQNPSQVIQLFWNVQKGWSREIHIGEDAQGNSAIVREVSTFWKFEE